MSDVKIVDGSILTLKNDSSLGISGFPPLSINQVQKIAPVAAHIKEVNNIDPISVEALHVSEVKNIEPISIDRFNITNLPLVNMSLRQIPPVDLNVRRLPPVSIGFHQNFSVPSNYTVRARLLGIEFFRVNLDGETMIIPREKHRQEQGRTANRSFPETAVAGNPAIPSIYRETDTQMTFPASCSPHAHNHHNTARRPPAYSGLRRFMEAIRPARPESVEPPHRRRGPLSFGTPPVHFSLSAGGTAQPTEPCSVSSVSSGE